MCVASRGTIYPHYPLQLLDGDTLEKVVDTGNDDAVRGSSRKVVGEGERRFEREVGRKGRWALLEKSFAALLRDVEDEGKHL